MKPDCQQVLTQFASFSVEELSDSEAATLLHHHRRVRAVPRSNGCSSRSRSPSSRKAARATKMSSNTARSRCGWFAWSTPARQSSIPKSEKEARSISNASTRAKGGSCTEATSSPHAEGERAKRLGFDRAPHRHNLGRWRAFDAHFDSYALAAQLRLLMRRRDDPKLAAKTALVDYGRDAEVRDIGPTKRAFESLITAPTKNRAATTLYQAR